MRTVLHALAATTLALTLAACGEPPTVDDEDFRGVGTVTEKRADPARCEKRKSGRCTKTDDADWLLKVHKTNGDTVWVDVDKETYDSYDLTDADKAADAYPRT